MMRYILFFLIIFPFSNLFATYSVYNAKTGTINWNTKSDWIRHLSGTITYTAGSTAIVGSGTSFTTSLTVGDVIILQTSPGGATIGTVGSITDNTHLTLSSNALSSGTSVAFGIQTVPGINDDVTIGNSNVAAADIVAQIDALGAKANSITIASHAKNLSLTILSNYDLTVTTTVTVNDPNGAFNNYLNVNAGTLTVDGIAKIGTSNLARGYAKIVLTTGTINFKSNLEFHSSNKSNAVLDLTGGAGIVNVYGNIQQVKNTDIGHLNGGTTSIVNFCSSSITQSIHFFDGNSGDSYFQYANIYSNNTSAGGATIATSPVAAQLKNLYVQSGRLLNVLTSGKLVGSGIFSISNGATYETFGSSNNSKVPSSDFGSISLSANSTVKLHTTDGAFIDNATYGNLYLQSASTNVDYWMGASLTVLGNLVIGDGVLKTSIKTQNSTYTLNVSGNITIDAASVMDVGFKTFDIFVGGNWTNNGIYNSGGIGTVTFNGTGTQTIGGSSTTTFYNLTINNNPNIAGDVTLGANEIVSNQFTMTQGNFNFQSYNLSLGTAAASPGTLVHTAGWIYGNTTAYTFTRYFGTGTIANGDAKGFFPLGTSTDFRPFYISTPSSSITTGGSISMFHYDPNTLTTNVKWLDNGDTIKRQAQAYWNTSGASGMAGGSFNILAGGTGLGSVGLVSDLRITYVSGKADGSKGTNSGTTSSPRVQRTGLSISQIVRGAPSTYYIGSVDPVSSPLPIELLNFSASKAEQIVELKWATLSETNNDYFIIERSVDGVNFQNLATIKGAGTSIQLLNYNYIDSLPFNHLNYYRLKQVDYDGKYSYSDIKAVDFHKKVEIIAYPNPCSNTLYLDLSKITEDQVSVKIMDINGACVYQESDIMFSNKVDKIILIPFTNLSKGVYIVNLYNENTSFYQNIRVVK